MRGSPRREHDERLVDQPPFVLGRWARVQLVVLADGEVRALKAGVDSLRQPTFDASNVMMVKVLGARLAISLG
jgi:hypothetical protein